MPYRLVEVTELVKINKFNDNNAPLFEKYEEYNSEKEQEENTVTTEDLLEEDLLEEDLQGRHNEYFTIEEVYNEYTEKSLSKIVKHYKKNEESKNFEVVDQFFIKLSRPKYKRELLPVAMNSGFVETNSPISLDCLKYFVNFLQERLKKNKKGNINFSYEDLNDYIESREIDNDISNELKRMVESLYAPESDETFLPMKLVVESDKFEYSLNFVLNEEGVHKATARQIMLNGSKKKQVDFTKKILDSIKTSIPSVENKDLNDLTRARTMILTDNLYKLLSDNRETETESGAIKINEEVYFVSRSIDFTINGVRKDQKEEAQEILPRNSDFKTALQARIDKQYSPVGYSRGNRNIVDVELEKDDELYVGKILKNSKKDSSDIEILEIIDKNNFVFLISEERYLAQVKRVKDIEMPGDRLIRKFTLEKINYHSLDNVATTNVRGFMTIIINNLFSCSYDMHYVNYGITELQTELRTNKPNKKTYSELLFRAIDKKSMGRMTINDPNGTFFARDFSYARNFFKELVSDIGDIYLHSLSRLGEYYYTQRQFALDELQVYEMFEAINRLEKLLNDPTKLDQEFDNSGLPEPFIEKSKIIFKKNLAAFVAVANEELKNLPVIFDKGSVERSATLENIENKEVEFKRDANKKLIKSNNKAFTAKISYEDFKRNRELKIDLEELNKIVTRTDEGKHKVSLSYKGLIEVRKPEIDSLKGIFEYRENEKLFIKNIQDQYIAFNEITKSPDATDKEKETAKITFFENFKKFKISFEDDKSVIKEPQKEIHQGEKEEPITKIAKKIFELGIGRINDSVNLQTDLAKTIYEITKPLYDFIDKYKNFVDTNNKDSYVAMHNRNKTREVVKKDFLVNFDKFRIFCGVAEGVDIDNEIEKIQRESFGSKKMFINKMTERLSNFMTFLDEDTSSKLAESIHAATNIIQREKEVNSYRGIRS